MEPVTTADHDTGRQTLRQTIGDAIAYAGGMAVMFACEGMRQIGALVDGDNAAFTDVQRVFCCLLCS